MEKRLFKDTFASIEQAINKGNWEIAEELIQKHEEKEHALSSILVMISRTISNYQDEVLNCSISIERRRKTAALENLESMKLRSRHIMLRIMRLLGDLNLRVVKDPSDTKR